jgi:hypothetical protein
LSEERVDIFDTVGFVDDDIFKRELLERRLLYETDFIRGYTDIEILRDESIGNDLCAFLLGTSQNDNIYIRRPLLKLSSPVLKS